MERVRIGIVGLGWIGSEHGRNILANKKAVLAAVANPSGGKVSRFLKENNCQCRTFQNYRDLLDSDIDAVVIASPNDSHAEMCVDAARRGKHIFCEKPMAITIDDCRRVRDAVKKSGVKYLIGYHRRLNPLYQYAKTLLAEGKLGTPFSIESDYIHHVPGDWDIWKWAGKAAIAGNIFHGGSGHNVDLIRYFLGDIKEVACFKDVFLPRANPVETEDTAVAIFRFKNGALGRVQCCVGPIVPFTFNFKLYGTKGSVINNKVWFDSMPLFAEPGHEKDCIELPEKWIPDNVQGGIGEPWNKLTDHFIDMLTDNAECLNDVDSAYKTSAACFAAVKSAEENRIVSVAELE
jgi:predicted dehydrogenase